MTKLNKIGRNDPCPCGSGKKYKKCCINKPVQEVVEKRAKELSGPSPFDKETEKKINSMLNEGSALLLKNQYVKGCTIYLDLWEMIKAHTPKDFLSISDIDERVELEQYLYNWCQEFEGDLNNAGLDNTAFVQKRINFCEEFCQRFPETEGIIIHNMKRAIAESYFASGQVEKGEQVYQDLITEFPKSGWAYIGWGDMYYLWPPKNLPKDYAKAKSIYEKALRIKQLEDKSDVLERLESLEEEMKKK
jgi:tetratricopeptide (TPR) repeat protein